MFTPQKLINIQSGQLIKIDTNSPIKYKPTKKITTFNINNNGALQKHRLTATLVNNTSISADNGLCECFHIHKLADKIIHLNFICRATISYIIVQQFTTSNRVVSPRLGAGLLPRRVAVDPTSRTPAVKDGAKTISDCHERFISERRPNPAASSVVRSIYQDSSEKGRVETAMKRFAIEESR